MSDLETYRAKAAAWLESVAPTFGREARKHIERSISLLLFSGTRYFPKRVRFASGGGFNI